MELCFLLLCTFLSILSVLILQLYNTYWLQPEKVLEKLSRQGIRGPRRRFLTGNQLDMKRISATSKANRGSEAESLTSSYDPILFPYFHQWRKDYGPLFIYSNGKLPSLYVSDPDLVREISRCVSLDLGKATHLQKMQEPLFGHGIIKSNGVAWVYQRKIISPEFFMDKVKGMVDLIVEAAMPLLRSWESRIESGGGSADFMVDEDLNRFSAEVISRACFGSSYSRGKEIFQTLRAIQKAMSKSSSLFNIPTLRFLALKEKWEVGKLCEEVRWLILNVVKERREEVITELQQKDLLQSILESKGCGTDFVVDNCKNIYFAGHDTTTVAITWCLMLLAAHRGWQDRAREEVIGLCGGGTPDANMLHDMKILTTIIQETLRLFPPSAFVSRESFKDMRLGELTVPKGTNIWVPIATLHHDKTIWGQDADQFRPDRFANGVRGACSSPQAYMPFGLGARKCVGQNLAMVELKIVMSLILSKFDFSLSSRYRHSPEFRLTIAPEFGLYLVIRKL